MVYKMFNVSNCILNIEFVCSKTYGNMYNRIFIYIYFEIYTLKKEKYALVIIYILY